jgi:hypothetical protein
MFFHKFGFLDPYLLINIKNYNFWPKMYMILFWHIQAIVKQYII